MLYEVVSKRSSVVHGSLSIADVNDILDELSKNTGKQYAYVRCQEQHFNVRMLETSSRKFSNVPTVVPPLKNRSGSFASSLKVLNFFLQRHPLIITRLQIW